jgi:Serine carboxypeptidase
MYGSFLTHKKHALFPSPLNEQAHWAANNSSMILRSVLFQLSIVIWLKAKQGCSAAIPSPDDFLVHGLDKIEPAFGRYDGDMYAGLVPTTLYRIDTSSIKQKEKKTEEDGALMFWLYAPTNPTHTDTLVIWLNGGPGCSSCT